MAYAYVNIDYSKLTARLRYFYKQVKSIANNDALKEDINRKIIKAADEDSLLHQPYWTGALEGSTPADGDVKDVPYSITYKKTGTEYINYASGSVDAHGIYWEPYHISNSGKKILYADFPSVNWDPTEEIQGEYHAYIEAIVVEELFTNENGMKTIVAGRVSGKNRYVITDF